jgi:multisubunit Na+/H+ antiporter MnhG subunit
MFLALLGAFALLQFVDPHPQVQAASAGKTLKVKLNYTGAGVVDEKHKI